MNSFNDKGFTLIELMIGMALMSVILAGVAGIIPTSIRSFQYSISETCNVQESRAILARVSKEIRNAVKITYPLTSGTGQRIDYIVKVDNSESGNGTKEIDCSIYVTSTDNGNAIVIVRDKEGTNETKEYFARNRVESIQFIRSSDNSRNVVVEVTLKDKSVGSLTTEKLTTSVTTLNSL